MTDSAHAPLQAGRPWPLGADCGAAGVNFAVWAPDATAVELCLFDATGTTEKARLRLPACTDGVWHGLLPGMRLEAGASLVYGLRAHGPWAPRQGHRFNPAKLLLDPWAREVVGRYGRQGPGPADDPRLAAELARHQGSSPDAPDWPDPHDNAATALKARLSIPTSPRPRPPRPHVAADLTVLYEAHVRGLTMAHPDIPADLRGSYAALAHPAMLAHYRALGITTLALLPIHFRADEAALQRRGLANHWGYSPIAWLAPEPRYGSGRPGTTPEGELIEAIDQLHAAGLEVILDVVFNHSAELDHTGPTLSLRGLANARAYRLGPDGVYLDWTGCGNALNLGEPRIVELVLGALRHWATHYRVDGFRFDLATTLARNRHGEFDPGAPFLAALQADPQLSRLKWIAEPWDLGPGGYRLGSFPAGWLEWNDQYRDTLRRWWLLGHGDRGGFAHRFAASSGQFHHDGRGPLASVNFICAHDGFTLRDLVSHDHRHNAANGEHNRDGHPHNASWNCGVEGDTADPVVLALRHRLQRALLATLLLSQGTPMLLAGDEIGHSQRGNNNAYCQDNATTRLAWAGADTALLACAARLLALRRRHPALRQAHWLQGPTDDAAPTVRWLEPDGRPLAADAWQADRGALAIWLQAAPATPADDSAPVLLLVNRDPAPCRFTPPAGAWRLAFDSDQPDGLPGDGDAFDCPGRTLRVLVGAPAPGAVS
ncbi:glycogen debranching protein GlgX [Zoogloea sp.]|uniref:glycogen debranching protein GlgX n=1 Tax=Zoogloea sp. TaxID=49181 RepID=UPI0035AF0C32